MNKTVIGFKTINSRNEFISIIDNFFKRNCNKTVSASMRYSRVVNDLKKEEFIDGRCDADNGDAYIYGPGCICLGLDTNSLGPYGTSDFWDRDEDGNVYSTTPKVESSIFIDHAHGVIVIKEDIDYTPAFKRVARA